MNKEFLLNLFFLISINLVIKPFYVFGIDLKVQNAIENYGLYFALLNFSYIFQIFSDLGIQQYNNRNIAQHNYLFDKYFSHLLVLKGGLSILFFVLSFCTAILVGYQWNELYILFFLLLNQIFITLIFFFRSNISGLQNYRLDSILSVMDKLLLILICIPLLWGPWSEGFTIEWFVYAQSLSFGLTMVISYVLTKQYLQGQLVFLWNSSLLKAILKQSIPYSLVVLLMTLYTRVDAVMIERLLYDPISKKGILESNIYAAAYRLLDAINMICFLFAGLLLPMFSKMIKQKESVIPLWKLSNSLMLVVTISFSIAVCFNASEIMTMLYDNYNPEMASVLILLMIGFNSIGIIHIVGTLLTANGNLLQMNIVFAIGILLNIVSNYFLILVYGAWGAAISTILTQSFVAIIELEIARRVFKPHINWLFFLQITIFVGLVLCCNWGLKQTSLHWFVQFALAGIIAVLVAFLIKLLDIKAILAALSERKKN